LRIANGSGSTTTEVNQLLKQFKDVQKMMKMLGKGPKGLRGARELMSQLPQMSDPGLG
jgi:signal recognition particle subunit SRP54